MIHERPDDPRGDELEELERVDRLRDLTPPPPLDNHRHLPLDQHPGRPNASLRERVAAERRLEPGRWMDTRRARLVVAGDVVDELERQHLRAYRRRQERKARAHRRRRVLGAIAEGALYVLLAIVLAAIVVVIMAPPA